MISDHESLGTTRLAKASTGRLVFWLLVATVIFASCAMVVLTGAMGFELIGALLIVPLAIASIMTAWTLDESPDAVMALHGDGIDLSPAFGSGGRIPWAAVKSLKLFHLRDTMFFRVPFMGYLCVNLHDSRHIAPHLRLLPTSWSGRVFIPARFIRGGSVAAKRIMAAANEGLLNGRIDRDASADGVPQMMASADAAIARLVAERAAEPAPGTIRANDVPHRPQRPSGGFGRKQA
jgi:hypothetical protein